jgi:ribonuclease P protein component
VQHKLTKKTEFDLVYAKGSKKTAGPLLIHRLANNSNHVRLGLSVPKRVGNAVKRNRIKRLCREAFMLSHAELPNGIDILITIRPHSTLKLSEYQDLLLQGVSDA